MTISDKWKAVVGAVAAFVTGLGYAVEDGSVTLQEGGGLIVALGLAGLAVYKARNKPVVT